MPNQPAGAFWAVLNRLFVIGQTVVLFFLLPCYRKELWSRRIGFYRNAVHSPPPSPPSLSNKLTFISFVAVILSHRVDRFTLVSAFFLFSIGCLNVRSWALYSKNLNAPSPNGP
ncbi:hypothetical protein K443DRAFT_643345 [Laccaria amethystina LaAM-08-1]|jgi:hypothetical protein|uniref:Uncharacterized protein n=1 Tax=Laccaria amethystina LaAM-08-1 TaxID=1095629 RepID=A0A0C9WJ13_9AGAR|nr:hypothetical protein K443DRAFT_643345 [Laccaria amethystina LaAM-08-1]